MDPAAVGLQYCALHAFMWTLTAFSTFYYLSFIPQLICSCMQCFLFVGKPTGAILLGL